MRIENVLNATTAVIDHDEARHLRPMGFLLARPHSWSISKKKLELEKNERE